MSTALVELMQQEIEKHVDELTALTADLVRLPSYITEAPVSDYICTYLDKLHIPFDAYEPDVEVLRDVRGFVEVDYTYADRRNVSVVIKNGTCKRSIGLNGHMDTVPYDAMGTWRFGGALSGHIEGERLYGRGSADMKCGVAIMLVLLKILHANIKQLNGELQFHFVVDEENGGNGTLAALVRGYRPDAMIFLESTSPGIIIAANRGAQFFRLEVRGVEISVLWCKQYPNAIEKAAYLINRIEEYALQREAKAMHEMYTLFPHLNMAVVPLKICTIKGGNWASTMPGAVVMEGTIECLPNEEIEQVKKAFSQFLLDTCQQDEWLRDNPPRLEWFGLRLESASNLIPCELASTVSEAAEMIMGVPPIIAGAGGCDLRLPLLGYSIPSILYGAAGSGEHGQNEYVELKTMPVVAKIVARAVVNWLGR